jgi:hypothetical protein
MPVDENGNWYTANAVNIERTPPTSRTTTTGWKTRYAIETSTDDLATSFSNMQVSTPNSRVNVSSPLSSGSSWVTPNAISAVSNTEALIPRSENTCVDSDGNPLSKEELMEEIFGSESRSGSDSEYDITKPHNYEPDFIDDAGAPPYSQIRSDVHQIATTHFASQLKGAIGESQEEGIQFSINGIQIKEPLRPESLPPFLPHFGLNMIIGGNLILLYSITHFAFRTRKW